jgi:tetratricopeptide (TPR) repeat protein
MMSLLAGGAAVAEPAVTSATGAVLESSVKSGDACDAKLQSVQALEFYRMAEQLDPSNVHVLVSMSRQYRHLMTDAPSRDEKVRLGTVALGYAKRAAEIGRTDSDAQLAVAITYARMLPLLSKKEQVEDSRKIKDAADRALRLNSRNDLAWYVLGRWHQVLADVGTVKRMLGGLIYGSLPTTTNENAVDCFKKAIALNPGRLMNYVELGRTYAQMGRNDEARKWINKGMSMPNKEKDDPECKARGRETLSDLK